MTDARNQLAPRDPSAIIEKVVIQGDLAQLAPTDRVAYYSRVCESLGLNPLTKPFEYIELNGKLTLYAKRDATDQLRHSRKINVTIISRETIEGVYVVTARATTPDGRSDESIGAVPITKEGGTWETSQNGKRYFKGNGEWLPLRGDDLANALMKAETKAKRRVTLSIAGLGWLDETEIETIPSARHVVVPERVIDTATGEIVEPRNGGSSAPDNSAEIARIQAKRAKLMKRWETLWAEACQLGINKGLDAISSTASIDEITDRGRELALRIQAAKDDRAALAARAVEDLFPGVSDGR